MWFGRVIGPQARYNLLNLLCFVLLFFFIEHVVEDTKHPEPHFPNRMFFVLWKIKHGLH